MPELRDDKPVYVRPVYGWLVYHQISVVVSVEWAEPSSVVQLQALSRFAHTTFNICMASTQPNRPEVFSPVANSRRCVNSRARNFCEVHFLASLSIFCDRVTPDSEYCRLIAHKFISPRQKNAKPMGATSEVPVQVNARPPSVIASPKCNAPFLFRVSGLIVVRKQSHKFISPTASPSPGTPQMPS